MKKQLQKELVALAEKIVQADQYGQVEIEQLKEQARSIYEKLTILHFTEINLSASVPPKNQEESIESAPAEEGEPAAQDREVDEYAPDGTQFNDSEAITEPNTEKIKDIVAQMPPESEQIDEMLNHIIPKKNKNEMEELGGVHYDRLPKFEPVNVKAKDKPRSLNERLKKTIHIGVNDRHAFVKHLFEGSTVDYNRVLSQLNTIKTKKEAFDFVLNMVKPDYNNWEGKEEYEERFLGIVENKFEQ